jgi:hypothetical protein
MSAYAAFFTESRTRLIDSTKLHRKSGVAGGTEADLARAHEVLPPFKPFEPYINPYARMSPSRMAGLRIRKFQHEAKTGHYQSLRPPGLRPLPPSDLS